jgi:hypothetical protein
MVIKTGVWGFCGRERGKGRSGSAVRKQEVQGSIDISTVWPVHFVKLSAGFNAGSEIQFFFRGRVRFQLPPPGRTASRARMPFARPKGTKRAFACLRCACCSCWREALNSSRNVSIYRSAVNSDESTAPFSPRNVMIYNPAGCSGSSNA